MALHGDIKVNNEIVGYWEAVRVQEELEAVNLYRAAYWYIDQEGNSYSGEGLFVSHTYDQGAFMLSAKVALTVDNDIKAQRGEG